MSRRVAGPVAVLTALALAACSNSATQQEADKPSSATPSAPSTSDPVPSAATTPATSTSASTTTAAPSSSSAAATCADRIAARLTPQQRVGQLVMIGLQAGSSPSSVTRIIAQQHVGNVLYLGGWERSVTGISAELQTAATPAATGGVRLLIAADQEGGIVWQLRDPSSPRLPSALTQGGASPSQRVAYGRQIGNLLQRNGINTNLAPVADTVPASLGTANDPIGRHQRQYAFEPDQVGASVQDLVKGMHAGGVATTLKHFPGLGRVRGNTDFTASGIDDPTTTRNDSYLNPFKKGIESGSELVMMSSARYPKIDGANQALFSRTIITDVLRTQLGFGGIVITDDLNARAVSSVSVPDRAVRFVAAGGDILLTGRAADAAPMTQALLRRSASDPAFARQVDASVRRVLAVKVKRGLASCE